SAPPIVPPTTRASPVGFLQWSQFCETISYPVNPPRSNPNMNPPDEEARRIDPIGGFCTDNSASGSFSVRRLAESSSARVKTESDCAAAGAEYSERIRIECHIRRIRYILYPVLREIP